MVLGKLDFHLLKMKWDPYLMPFIKINSKWFSDQNIRAKIIKILQEKIGVNLHDFDLPIDSQL